jgi:hypothetical protein
VLSHTFNAGSHKVAQVPMASGLEAAKLGTCEICYKYFPKFQRRSSHMSRLSFLEKSAENGCCLCALLYRKVSQNAEEFEILEQLDLVLSRNRRLVGYWLQKLTHDVAGSEQATTLYQESNLYLAPLEGFLEYSIGFEEMADVLKPDILPCLNP